MRARREHLSLGARVGLTRQVALLSLLPMVVLGFILARVLQAQIVSGALDNATESARIIAHLGIEPHLSAQDLHTGLTPAGVRELDVQLSGRSVTQDLARIKIWNSRYKIIYSDDHSLIGRTLPPSADLRDALANEPDDADVVTPRRHSETASEVGLGQLVEVYVPLRFAASGLPEGAFEIYLSYRPIAAAIAGEKRTIALLVAIGLALLWLILYRIVARASRRLRRQARENDRLARYDQLTGLANRTLFLEGVTEIVRRGCASPQSVAVLLIDLDRFTEINNTLGHANGDRVLCEVARRLCTTFAENAHVARLGADEFAIVAQISGGAVGARQAAADVQESLEPPVVIDDVALNVEASIGIAVAHEQPERSDLLLQRADTALARARSRASRVHLHSASDDFDPSRLILLGQVRGALEREEFVLHYQPKVDLQRRRITGVEALVRWRHPEHGLLAPGAFIPQIEPTALVGPFTMYVIERALRQMAAWRRRGIDLEMSVNLSARNLLDPALPAQIDELLRRHGVPAERLTVEVTESAALADPDRAIAALEVLRASGIAVSIDDFGTGNASIEYLAALPASELKIDRSFITGMLEDARAEAIVRSTIDLARNLGLTVVAEGIETEAVMERLGVLGAETGQGFLISRPLPAEELTEQLIAAFGIAGGDERGDYPAVAPVAGSFS
ncbi:MAG TPA: bifunctional diguanylate cyclase/phosphodiesterase [Solirubrobacteraceae bacterium]|jgi:diguanylate cyclase (GGDEF)-like protein|nr:bifunctional diguanylate cyclase/phosphodiesterase [Solirubrobacteraceae bacterium]